MSQMGGCGTAVVLIIVGIIAIPVGMSLPQDTLGLVVGVLIGLVALVPLCAVLMMAMGVRHRSVVRQVKLDAEREIEHTQQLNSSGGQQVRQWVIMDQEWALTPQQAALRQNMVTLNASRRERPAPQHEPQVYYGDMDDAPVRPVRRQTTPARTVRPVTPVYQPGGRELVEYVPELTARQPRNFQISGHIRRTDVFKIVGE